MAKTIQKSESHKKKSQKTVKRATRQTSVSVKGKPSAKASTVGNSPGKTAGTAAKTTKKAVAEVKREQAVVKKTATLEKKTGAKSKQSQMVSAPPKAAQKIKKNESTIETNIEKIEKTAPNASKSTARQVIAKPKKTGASKPMPVNAAKDAVVTKTVESVPGERPETIKKEHKNPVSPDDLRETLLNRRSTIMKFFDDDIDQEKEAKSGIVGDVIDVAQDSNEHEMTFQLAEVESRELGQIDKALTKIGDGSYGTCEDCGGKISAARLKALPFASKCIKCQEVADAERDAPGNQNWTSSFRPESSAIDNSMSQED